MHPIKRMLGGVVILGVFFLASPLFYTHSPLYTPITKAIAVIYPTKGNSAQGVAHFHQQPHCIHVKIECSGLTPGNHGIHIHEFGHCACDDGICAGSHFNPTKQPHGGLTDRHRHIGDFGNIVANEKGEGILEFDDTRLTLNGAFSIIGRSIIVHEQEDDLVSQPTGNSGNRVGCGCIGIGQD